MSADKLFAILADRHFSVAYGFCRGVAAGEKRDRTATPGAPTEAMPGHVTHAELGQICLVLPCAADVEDSEPAARTKYAHGFVDSFLTAGCSTDVVNCQAG